MVDHLALSDERRQRKREYDRARYLANQEAVKARVRERYHADPEPVKAYQRAYVAEHRDVVVERKREYVATHREQHNARNRRWKQANPTKVAATNRQWKQANLARHAETERRRAAAKRGTVVERIDYATVCDRDGWSCQLCGDPVDRSLRHPDPMSGSIDHVVPLAAGGPHTYANVQLAHLRCNISKGARHAAAA